MAGVDVRRGAIRASFCLGYLRKRSLVKGSDYDDRGMSH